MKQVPEDESKNFFQYHHYLSQVEKIAKEWDSLIIIPQLKMVINIEVKSGVSFNALNKAARQTNDHLKIFKNIFGANLSPEWKFVKAAFTPNLSFKIKDKQPCEFCKKFVITDNKKIAEWIENLKCSQKNIFTCEDYKKEYENLLVGIIGYSSLRQTLNKKILDPEEFIQATKSKVTDSDTFNDEKSKEILREKGVLSKSEYFCYMLTADQLMAVKDPSSHMIIEGDYGCGKTYVLKERTKQYAEKYPKSKIAYINITADPSYHTHVTDMMDIIADNNFKDYKYNNVDVVAFMDLYGHYSKYKDELKDVTTLFGSSGEECSLVIKHFLEHSTYDYIFIDEMPPFVKKTDEKLDFFSKNNNCCITMKCDILNDNINEEWISQMGERHNVKKITLKQNMRNSETIVSLSKCFDGNVDNKNQNLPIAKVIPNDITGPVCHHYLNIHKLDNSLLTSAAIQEYFCEEKESVLVLLTGNTDSGNTQTLYTRLLEYFSTTDRKIVYLPVEKKIADYGKHIEEVKEYLEKPEGILVTDNMSFQGAQARNTIIIADNITDNPHLRNMILRTMSFAIIIHEEDIKQSVPGLERIDNLHEQIHPGGSKEIYFCNNNEYQHKRSCNWPRKRS